MPRCNDCNKTMGWDEATDIKWTNRDITLDGKCYGCKKRSMRSKAMEIIYD